MADSLAQSAGYGVASTEVEGALFESARNHEEAGEIHASVWRGIDKPEPATTVSAAEQTAIDQQQKDEIRRAIAESPAETTATEAQPAADDARAAEYQRLSENFSTITGRVKAELNNPGLFESFLDWFEGAYGKFGEARSLGVTKWLAKRGYQAPAVITGSAVAGGLATFGAKHASDLARKGSGAVLGAALTTLGVQQLYQREQDQAWRTKPGQTFWQRVKNSTPVKMARMADAYLLPDEINEDDQARYEERLAAQPISTSRWALKRRFDDAKRDRNARRAVQLENIQRDGMLTVEEVNAVDEDGQPLIDLPTLLRHFAGGRLALTRHDRRGQVERVLNSDQLPLYSAIVARVCREATPEQLEEAMDAEAWRSRKTLAKSAAFGVTAGAATLAMPYVPMAIDWVKERLEKGIHLSLHPHDWALISAAGAQEAAPQPVAPEIGGEAWYQNQLHDLHGGPLLDPATAEKLAADHPNVVLDTDYQGHLVRATLLEKLDAGKVDAAGHFVFNKGVVQHDAAGYHVVAHLDKETVVNLPLADGKVDLTPLVEATKGNAAMHARFDHIFAGKTYTALRFEELTTKINNVELAQAAGLGSPTPDLLGQMAVAKNALISHLVDGTLNQHPVDLGALSKLGFDGYQPPELVSTLQIRDEVGRAMKFWAHQHLTKVAPTSPHHLEQLMTHPLPKHLPAPKVAAPVETVNPFESAPQVKDIPKPEPSTAERSIFSEWFGRPQLQPQQPAYNGFDPANMFGPARHLRPNPHSYHSADLSRPEVGHTVVPDQAVVEQPVSVQATAGLTEPRHGVPTGPHEQPPTKVIDLEHRVGVIERAADYHKPKLAPNGNIIVEELVK